jgi:hypothetical protein
MTIQLLKSNGCTWVKYNINAFLTDVSYLLLQACFPYKIVESDVCVCINKLSVLHLLLWYKSAVALTTTRQTLHVLTMPKLLCRY